ncbi:MAG: histidinol-phosphate transaminase [Pseudomonadota bacterium]
MKTPEQLIRPDILELSAYPVPDASGYIKLDAMENPYAWPEAMLDAWTERLRQVAMNRYPDPAAKTLTARLKQAMAVPEGQSVMLGNGSDEIIQIMAMAMARPGATLMALEPGFVMYKMIARFTGMDYLGVPLGEEDFSLDLERTLEAVKSHQPELIFIAYPNNPTANAFERGDIEAIIAAAEGLVVIDEAYQPFAEDSFMGDLGRFPNMLVMRTVSKLGLAGLRLGVLAGSPEWLVQFDKVRLPYNINVLTQHSAEFALEHLEEFERQAAQIRHDRQSLMAALAAIEGIQVYPSRANFILFRLRSADAGAVFEGLRQRGVLIKNMSKAGGVLRDCLRVTVGTPEENTAFLEALKDSL